MQCLENELRYHAKVCLSWCTINTQIDPPASADIGLSTSRGDDYKPPSSLFNGISQRDLQAHAESYAH